MTRSEAALKWCPHMSGAYEHSVSKYNANGTYIGSKKKVVAIHNPMVAGTNCVHERCMMWRTPLNDPDSGHCGLASYG